MEKVAVTGFDAGIAKGLRAGACAAAVCALGCPAVWAQEAGGSPADALLASQVEPPVRVQVQASSLPRLEAHESGFHAPRVDVSLFPSRPLGIGAVVGMSGFTAPRGALPPGLQPARPSVDLGIRFSQRVYSQEIDITAWRRMNTEPDAYTLIQMQQPVYGARVEMNLSPARKSGLAASLGFVGLQLQSGARISIKRKNGGPMIYYRTTF